MITGQVVGQFPSLVEYPTNRGFNLGNFPF